MASHVPTCADDLERLIRQAGEERVGFKNAVREAGALLSDFCAYVFPLKKYIFP